MYNISTFKSSNESYTTFIEQFVKLLEKLLPHHFVSVRQQKYFEDLKNNLPLNSMICATDFSENYILEENFQVQSAWLSGYNITICLIFQQKWVS